MATTTNFGWDTPDDTDLVKDGAAAIRTALNGVDTSFVDLKGGTTGQVLAKNSDTDLDFIWSADAAGMTNPMTTTGDTIYSSSGSTPARLGIGTAGQVLTVNSGATAPEWAAVSGGGFTYAAYTPTFTNFTLGNGTINKARYAQSGKLVHVYIQVTLGSTSSVSGNITVALPVTAASDQVGLWTGPAAFSDSGVGSYTGLVQISSTTAAKPDVNDASGTYPKITGLSSTVPFTWTTSDGFRLSFIYEAA